MLSWLGGFLVSPWLAVIGVIAIASPIIIHLLNKRRFKIVDWAAMEFLFDADKRNRRRVRLENLILLLLRCLALFLLGLLLARPFAESLWTARLIDAPRFERIILLDDSLSMTARTDNRTAFDEARDSLDSLAQGFANDHSEDFLTVILTSRPNSPLINGQLVRDTSIKEIHNDIRNITPSDKSANLNVALLEVEKQVTSENKNVNRVVYVMTDLREHDWKGEVSAEDENHPTRILERLAKQTSGCFLVDVGNDQRGNIAITSVVPEDTLIAGVSSRFDVTVANHGAETVEDLTVRFLVGNQGETLPLEQEIAAIEAGKTELVSFNLTFSPEDLVNTEIDEEGNQVERHKMASIRITAQVVSNQADKQDRLLADSERYFAARVVRGIPALVVDGDPSASLYESEAFYLARALSPPGDVLSGIVVDTVTDTELETVSLAKYRVIFLLNVDFEKLSGGGESPTASPAESADESSDRRIAKLEQWTKAGGGLVIMPGNQINEEDYNQLMFRGGKGLSPFRLDRLRGDAEHSEWTGFHVVNTGHPVLRIFEGQSNPFLERVKIFQWWGAEIPKETDDSSASVLARFTDLNDSLAVVERPYGNGRVLATTIPADRDWTNWADDPSYLLAMNDVVRHMSGSLAGHGDLRVGEPLRFALDLVDYEEKAELKLPVEDELPVTVQAIQQADDAPGSDGTTGSDGAPGESASKTVWQISYDGANRRGFYELNLARNSGGRDDVLFAANVDPTEGDLRRLSAAARGRITSDTVKIVSSHEAAAQAVRGLRKELWKAIFIVVVVVLCCEQFLAWLFGRRR